LVDQTNIEFQKYSIENEPKGKVVELNNNPLLFPRNPLLEVISGPMFSGKTEELLRRIRRAEIARQKIQVFKPALDNRYGQGEIVSHIGKTIDAIPVEDAFQILRKIFPDTQVVAIDEVQFFDESIIGISSSLVNRGIRVILAGLDQDHLGRPFGAIPHLLAIADRVDKMQAICTVCGGPATKSLRKSPEKSGKILIGEKDLYEARCRAHFIINKRETKKRENF
jgi:thymidine kinase